MDEILRQLKTAGQGAAVLLIVALVGAAACWAAWWLLRRAARRAASKAAVPLLRNCAVPAGAGATILFVWMALPLSPLDPWWQASVAHVLSLALIASVAWTLVRISRAFGQIVRSRYRTDVPDNLQARRMHTQFRILNRVVVFVVALVALCAALMTFDRVRQFGVSLLASAGVIGIIIGIAAQKTLGSLLAGIQVAITQPIRLDDVVIVENEFGKIEEITLTYVVVRIWDLRRLVVPIIYFLETPFQNWTRVTADLLGTVFLYVDYTVPVEAVRQELSRIVEASETWDRKVCVLQTTNATERVVELRGLVSAKDAPTLWNLRCEVRERLLDFIQKNYPSALPRVRLDGLGGQV